MKKLVLLSWMISLTTVVQALEIDERLTARILRVSATKKTILVNRGLEDGLVVGDHAKFFLTTEVFARAVVAKASPTRSVWSVYRLINPAKVEVGNVATLKVSTPLRLTDDPSKAITADGFFARKYRNRNLLNVETVVYDDADNLENELIDLRGESNSNRRLNRRVILDRGNRTEIPIKDSINDPILSMTGVAPDRDWEVWGSFHLYGLSGTSTQNDFDSDVESNNLSFTLGFEKYFFMPRSFFTDFSLQFFYTRRTQELGGTFVASEDWSEYGVGVSYHFWYNPLTYSRLIPFANFTLGIGSGNLATVDNSGSTTTDFNSSSDGTSNFFSLGGGGKFNLSNGWGVRFKLDYYRTSETYTFSADNDLTRTLAGFRTQVGLGYRF